MRERGEAEMMTRRERLCRHGFFDEIRAILRIRSFETHGFEEMTNLERDRIKIPQRNIGVPDSTDRAHGGRIARREFILKLVVPVF
jgi:hypothetical protein